MRKDIGVNKAGSARVRQHIRSNVIGYVALFVALSGTAYATHPGGTNTINSEDIINGEVKTADIRDANITRHDLGIGSVNSAKVVDDSLSGGDVLNESLTLDDLGANSVTASELANGAVVGGAGGDVSDASLTGADLDTGSVVGGAGGDVQDDSLTNDDVGPNAIGASELAFGAVVGGQDGDVEDDTISTFDVLNNTLTAADLSNRLGTTFLGSDIDPTEAAAADDFINLVDGSSSSTEANEDLYNVPISVIASNLRAEVDAAPGAGLDRWTITVRDDGVDMAIGCQIDEDATLCSDSVTQQVIDAGSRLTVGVDSDAEGGGGSNDPNAASSLKVSFALTP